QPWFLQNLTVFAPDPPMERHELIYRLKRNNQWGKWHNPRFRYLRRQWLNRFDPAVKTHDQMETISSHVHYTFTQPPGDEIIKTQKGVNLPAVLCVRKIIRMHEEMEE